MRRREQEIRNIIDRNQLKLLVKLQLNPNKPLIEIMRDMRQETPTLGSMLRQARQDSYYTIKDLHQASGVAASTIFYTETGQTVPRPGTLKRLTEALGIDPKTIAPYRNTG